MTHTLLTVARQLDEWAEYSQRGGWSTHLVTPMNDLANELRKQHYYEQFKEENLVSGTGSKVGEKVQE